MTKPSALDVIHAYRSLYRAGLHAVQYSKPNRYTLRDQLRQSFRKEDPTTFDHGKISRTVEFLNLAASERGLEHRIVKSMLHTKWWYSMELKHFSQRSPNSKRAIKPNLKEVMIPYNMNLAMLNDTMGLCLR